MNRKTLPLIALLLLLAMVLAACPAADPGTEAPVVQEGAAGEAQEDEVAEEVGEEAAEAVDEDAPPAELTAMLWDAARPGDEEAAAYCNEQTGLNVEVVNGPESATDRLALYLQFFGAQSGDIDIMQIDVIWPGILAEHLIDLAPYVDNLDAHFPAIVENNTVDGALVGIPWFTDAGLLYYRTDLLEEYGYDGPPMTWAELEEMATTIQEGERADNPDFWGYVWQGNAYEGLTCNALEWQYSWGGGRIVEPDGTITINNPDAVAAFDTAASWVGTISPPGVTSYQEEDARNVWNTGSAAFMRNWPYAYALGQAEDSPIAGAFDVTVLPMGDGAEAQHAATLGGWQMAVSAYSENQDAAAEWAACMASDPEAQKLRATIGSSLPTIESLYEDEDVLEARPFFGALLDVFTSAVARPSTVTGDQYNEVSTIYFTEVHRVLTGQQTGEEAVAEIEDQLDSLLN